MKRNFDTESPLILFRPESASLGLTARTKRKIKDGKEFDHYFPQSKGTSVLVRTAKKVTDITDEIKRIVRETLWQTEKIAPLFKRNTVRETAQAIDDFVRNHIQYAEENDEELRQPARVWADRFTGVDCDCYAIFISSILTNLGIPHYYRLAEYQNKGYYQHIYVILNDDSGKRIVIDCVKDHFNQEHPYTNIMDLNVKVKELGNLNTEYTMENAIPFEIIRDVRANRAHYLRGDDTPPPAKAPDAPDAPDKKEDFMTKAEAFVKKYWWGLALVAAFVFYMFRKKMGFKGLSGTKQIQEGQKPRNNWKKMYEDSLAKIKQGKKDAEWEEKISSKEKTIATLRHQLEHGKKK